MFIKELYTQNINSLKGDCAIDFTQDVFINNPIFAITGDIGAGKSSLLDAICLALYQKTPRVKSTSAEELNQGQITTIGTTSSYAKIVFENKGKTYRSSWMAGTKTQGDNKGLWNAPTVDLEVFENGVFVSLPNASNKREHTKCIEEIVGLSFDQFEKTILLAQGSFSKLLKAKEEDRTNIIEKLTGTEEYRNIGKQIFQTAKDKRIEIQKLKNHNNSQSETLLTNDELIQIEEEKTRLIAKSQTDKKALDNQRAEILKIETHQKLSKETQDLQKKITALEQNNDRIKNLQLIIDKHNAANALSGILEKFKSAKKQVSETVFELEDSEKKLANATAAISDFQVKQEETLPIVAGITDQKAYIERIGQELSELKLIEVDKIAKDGSIENLKVQSKSYTEALRAEKKRLDVFNQSKADQKATIETCKTFFAQNQLSSEEADEIRQKLQGYADNFSQWKDECKGSIELSLNLNDANQVLAHWKQKLNDVEGKELSDNQIPLAIEQHKATAEELSTFENKNLILNQEWAVEKDNVGRIEATQKEQKDLTESLLGFTKNLEERASKKETIAVLKKDFELNLNASKERFKSLHLSDGKAVETLRNTLIDDEPCMVCGSTTHPFCDSNNKSLQLFGEQKLVELELEKKIDEASNKIAALEKEMVAINSSIENAKSRISTLEKNTKEEIDKLKFLKSKGYDLTSVSVQNAYEIELKNLNLEKTKVENKLKLLEAQIQVFYSIKIEKIASESNALRIEINEKTKSVELNRDALVIYSKSVHEDELKQKNAIDKIAELEGSIKSSQVDLDSIEKKKAVIEKEIIEQQSASDKLKSELSKRFKSYETVADYTITFNREYQKLSSDISNFKNSIKTLKDKVSLYTENLKKTEEEFSKQATVKGFASEEEIAKALLESQVLEGHTLQIKTHNDNLISTKTNLDSIQKALNELGSVTTEQVEQLDNLKATFIALNQENEALNKSLGSIEQQLKSDKESKEKLAGNQLKIDALEKAYIPFGLLDNALGDATGKTFANVAARYTFNTLLEFTNYHLKSLKSRYTFKPIETLSDKEQDLLIIDSHLGHAVRPAKSTLSGGETFLTSLCLALALSDLSANKVQIKSLFIDEGFGSLDQDSLHEAISLLENLPDATGKTIGIISHIEALKQRIPIQIELKKQGNGFSKMKLPYTLA